MSKKSNQQEIFADIIRWQQSGLTQKAWCEQNNFSYSFFHYWYKRFRNLQSKDERGTAAGFVQLLPPDRSSGTPWCELVFGNGKKLLFHQAVPVALIKSLMD